MTENCLIVTGIPRSGTSLLAALISEIPDAICLNEVLYDVRRLPAEFNEVRRRLVAGEPLPNKFDGSGQITTDTLGDESSLQKQVLGEYSEKALIGSKVNVPYLFNLNRIFQYGYPVVAVVRDPVYAIGSWASEKAEAIPEAHVTDGDMHPRWRNIDFECDTKLGRQAELWNRLGRIIYAVRKRILLVRYEDLVDHPEPLVESIVEAFDLFQPSSLPELQNYNVDDRYPRLDEIRDYVREYIPIRRCFGYD